MFNPSIFQHGQKIYHVGRNQFGTFVEYDKWDFTLAIVEFNGEELKVKRKWLRNENKKIFF